MGKKHKARNAKQETAGSRKAPVEGVAESGVEGVVVCDVCAGEEFTEPVQVNELEHAGEEDGEAYTHTVWERTKCLGCGQVKTIRRRENRETESMEAAE